jgi:hypothetical protein
MVKDDTTLISTKINNHYMFTPNSDSSASVYILMIVIENGIINYLLLMLINLVFLDRSIILI